MATTVTAAAAKFMQNVRYSFWHALEQRAGKLHKYFIRKRAYLCTALEMDVNGLYSKPCTGLRKLDTRWCKRHERLQKQIHAMYHLVDEVEAGRLKMAKSDAALAELFIRKNFERRFALTRDWGHNVWMNYLVQLSRKESDLWEIDTNGYDSCNNDNDYNQRAGAGNSSVLFLLIDHID